MLEGERAQRRKEKETINTIDHQEKGSRERRAQNQHLMKERGGDVRRENTNFIKTQKGQSGKERRKCTFRVLQKSVLAEMED